MKSETIGNMINIVPGCVFGYQVYQVIITSLKSETMGNMINIVPGLRLWISSLPGSALKMLVESLGKPRDVNKRSQYLAW